MRKFLILTVFIILVSISLSILPCVYDFGNSREIVYTTDTGKDYHRASCGALWHSSHAHTLVRVARGTWGRCDRCNPPRPSFAWYWKIGFFNWIVIGYIISGFIQLLVIRPIDRLIHPQNDIPIIVPSIEASLYPGRSLWYKNKHTGNIESVIVTNCSEKIITIDYCGKPYDLEKQVIGKRLFLSPEEIK